MLSASVAKICARRANAAIASALTGQFSEVLKRTLSGRELTITDHVDGQIAALKRAHLKGRQGAVPEQTLRRTTVVIAEIRGGRTASGSPSAKMSNNQNRSGQHRSYAMYGT